MTKSWLTSFSRRNLVLWKLVSEVVETDRDGRIFCCLSFSLQNDVETLAGFPIVFSSIVGFSFFHTSEQLWAQRLGMGVRKRNHNTSLWWGGTALGIVHHITSFSWVHWGGLWPHTERQHNSKTEVPLSGILSALHVHFLHQ